MSIPSVHFSSRNRGGGGGSPVRQQMHRRRRGANDVSFKPSDSTHVQRNLQLSLSSSDDSDDVPVISTKTTNSNVVLVDIESDTSSSSSLDEPPVGMDGNWGAKQKQPQIQVIVPNEPKEAPSGTRRRRSNARHDDDQNNDDSSEPKKEKMYPSHEGRRRRSSSRQEERDSSSEDNSEDEEPRPERRRVIKRVRKVRKPVIVEEEESEKETSSSEDNNQQEDDDEEEERKVIRRKRRVRSPQPESHNERRRSPERSRSHGSRSTRDTEEQPEHSSPRKSRKHRNEREEEVDTSSGERGGYIPDPIPEGISTYTVIRQKKPFGGAKFHMVANEKCIYASEPAADKMSKMQIITRKFPATRESPSYLGFLRIQQHKHRFTLVSNLEKPNDDRDGELLGACFSKKGIIRSLRVAITRNLTPFFPISKRLNLSRVAKDEKVLDQFQYFETDQNPEDTYDSDIVMESVKNFRLTNPETGELVFQIYKYGESQYSVKCGAPLNPFLAFGLAVSCIMSDRGF